MLKHISIVTGLAAALAVSIAAPGWAGQTPTQNNAQCSCQMATMTKTDAKKKPESKPKLIDVKVCPIMHANVRGKGVGSEVVGKYRVFFCCKGCPEAFDKLTAPQKLQKAQEAYIIQKHREKVAAKKKQDKK